MRRFIEAMPKVELHFHLRGGIPAWAIWRLAQKYHPEMKFSEYRNMLKPSNFAKFQHVYNFCRNIIKSESDLAFAARAAARQAAREKIIYTEIWFTPFSFNAIKPHRVLEIVSDEFELAGVDISFIGPLDRRDTQKAAEAKYEFYSDARDLGVRGIGLVGDEAGHPVPVFYNLFEKAKQDGFGVTIHAGEYSYRNNIVTAIMDLGADRIGHGNNIGRAALADKVIERGVHIEMCPISNMTLNREITPANYALPDYYRRGMSLCVNSDDPGIIGHTLTDNYCFIRRAYSFRLGDFRKMQLHAANAAFASAKTKEKLRAKIALWHSDFRASCADNGITR